MYLQRVRDGERARGPAANSQRRGRGALTACGTRRQPVPGGSVAASMPPHGPAIGEDTAPDSLLAVLLKAMHTDHLDGSLPAHRRGTLRGCKDVLAACPAMVGRQGPPQSCSRSAALRQPQAGAAGTRNRHVPLVCSGSCAPSVSTWRPLATFFWLLQVCRLRLQRTRQGLAVLLPGDQGPTHQFAGDLGQGLLERGRDRSGVGAA